MTLENSLKKLQNGSDIRGVALTGVDGEFPNLTPEEATLLSLGYLLWLSKKSTKKPSDLKISIGRDPRLSGKNLMQSCINALASYGVTVLDAGLASTPAMFMSTIFEEFACDGAIMITASHLPFNRNGFKYFDKEGGLNKSDISEIIAFAEDIENTKLALGEPLDSENFDIKLGKKVYHSQESNLMERYFSHLRNLIKDGVAGGLLEISNPSNQTNISQDLPLSGLHIVVDAGNGGGGFFAEKVLKPLGADITGSLYLEPDGTFPHHAPNPEDAEAMHSISMAVLGSGADLGLIFDTDVDRSAAVDSRGREISRNGIVAMAAALIAKEHPGTTVVTDSITSDELNVFLEEKLGLSHLRYKRGYKNVINKAIELNANGTDSQLAIETSGHAAFKENYFLDDGAYLATKIVIKTALLHAEGKAIDSIICDLQEPAEAKEVRFPILADDFAKYGDMILAELSAFVESQGATSDPNADVNASPNASRTEGTHIDMKLVTPNYEGVRITFGKSCGDGWCLLRKSLHDPIMPLNLESNTKGGIAIMSKILHEFLKKYEKLDISKL